MAEKRTIELEIQDNSKTLKQQYRDAVQELQKVSAQYGETSAQAIKAAKAAADLKDQIEFSKDLVGSFNPDAKFNALTRSIGGVLDGFQAFEGALGLVGVEGEAVQQTLLKVQSAMAVSQGIQGLMEAKDSFKQLGTVAMDALKGIRTGLAATGIGLFLVALGTIVAYWDDIKEAVSGVSAEQKKLNELSHANFETAKEELNTLDAQDNILKLQGKSEKDILQIKIKKIDAAIELGKIELANVIKTSKAEEEATLKNYKLTKQVVDFILDTALFLPKLMLMPIDMAIKGANKVSEALGFGKLIAFDMGKTMEDMQDKFSGFIAGSLFDVNEVKAEGEKTRKELEKQIQALENQKAGFQLTLRDLNKPDPKEKIKEDKKEIEDVKKKDEEILQLRTKSFKDIQAAKLQAELDEIAKQKELDKIKLDANQEYLDKIKKQEEEEAARKKRNRDFAIEMALSSLSTISNLTELFGKKNEKAAKRAFQVNKAAQLASAVISTYQSATSAYASQFVPPDPTSPVRGAIAAGVAVAAGLANVAKIASQKFEGGGSSGGGGGSSAGAGGGGAQMAAPQFNTIGTSGINQLATLQQQPTKAYVVSGEVTSAQSLDRNRLQNATL
jgi:hypothetical protein